MRRMERRCPQCVEALDIFVAAYGAEAGNMALRYVATAGVYVGGGIAPKILPALESGAFLDAFRDKEPMAHLVATMPVVRHPQRRRGPARRRRPRGHGWHPAGALVGAGGGSACEACTNLRLPPQQS